MAGCGASHVKSAHDGMQSGACFVIAGSQCHCAKTWTRVSAYEYLCRQHSLRAPCRAKECLTRSCSSALVTCPLCCVITPSSLLHSGRAITQQHPITTNAWTHGSRKSRHFRAHSSKSCSDLCPQISFIQTRVFAAISGFRVCGHRFPVCAPPPSAI